jgi:hypothetical protein
MTLTKTISLLSYYSPRYIFFSDNQPIIKMKSLIFVLLFIHIVTLPLNGQVNYKEGYIIDLQGDTIHGVIDYRDWRRNPERITFKKNLNASETQFLPEKIKEFRVENKIYASAKTNLNLSTTSTSSLKNDSMFVLEESMVFLQALILGEKKLYVFVNNMGTENFYISINGKYPLLKYKKYINKVEGILYKRERKNYRLQLRNYLSNCHDVKVDLIDIDYNRKELIKLFEIYYQKCSNVSISFENKTDATKWQFGVLGGVAITTVGFNLSETRTNTFNYLIKADFNTSTNYALAFFAEKPLLRNRRKISIYNELLISPFLVTGKYDDINNEEYYTKNNTKIGLLVANFNSMIRYKHLFKKSSIFFNGGLSGGILLPTINERNKEIKFYSSPYTEINTGLKNLKTLQIGGIVGLGAIINHIIIEGRYELKGDFSNTFSLDSRMRRVYFLVGYKF